MPGTARNEPPHRRPMSELDLRRASIPDIDLRAAAWKLRQVAPALGSLASLADPVAEWMEIESLTPTQSRPVAERVARALLKEWA